MRLPIVSAAAVFLMLTASARAEDDLRPVLEKAVKAMGGAEKLAKYQGAKVKTILDDKDKTFTLSPLGEAKVEGKEVIGVQVASKGHRDVNLFFDNKTGLVVKVERRAYDVQNEKEFTEERIIRDYAEVEGMKLAKKVLVNRDGKKFMEVEVEKTDVLESVDKDEFAKP